MDNKYRLSKIIHIILAMGITSALLISAGYYYYKREETNSKDQKRNELKAIADLKINQISVWYKDELADADNISQNPFLKATIKNYLSGRGSKEESILTKMLQEVKKEHDYDDIFIADKDASLYATTSKKRQEIELILKDAISLSSRKNIPTATDFFKNSFQEGKINLAFIAPIKDGNNKPLAVMVFLHKAESFIYPLLRYKPIQNESLETILVKRDGNSVLFLNNLKTPKLNALESRVPLTRTDLPPVKAVNGYKGMYEGKDILGNNVFAYLSPIPNTKWFMITKINKSDVMEELYSEAVLISILIILSIIVVGTGLFLYYNFQQKNIYKELYDREKKLWQSEEKFKVTLESLGEGIITTDTKGIVLYINKMAEILTGWTREEAKGQKLSNIYIAKNELTGERENNIIDKVLKKGIIKELGNHTLLISKEGKKIPVRDSGAPLFDSDGTLLGLVLTFNDETEKRLQLNLLKESEEKYRTVIEITRDALFINLNDTIVFVNPACIELFGAENENQILGKSPFEFFHPDYHNVMKERIKLMLAKSGSAPIIEEKIIKINGAIIDVEVTAIGFTYKDKPAIQVILRDITTRKRTEEQKEFAVIALRESEERYFQLFNTAPIGILVVSDELITFINPKAVCLFGASSNEQILNKPLASFIHPEYLEATQERLTRFLNGDRSLYPVENEYLRVDGSIFSVEVYVNPFSYQGKEAFQVIFNDITERKKMITDLISAKEKAEEINKVKSNFFANMSHELRTPFVGIMGYAELLLDSLTDPEYKEMAEGILTTSKRMKDTLTKILNLSKYEFNGLEIVPKILNLRNVVDEVYRQYIKAAEKKDLKLEIKLNDEPINIETDETILIEILNNLVSNAVIYTNEGEIEICAEKQIKNNTRIVVIKVLDTGIGIPEDKKEIIWEEFRQVSEGSTRSYQGTGLGLSIAKKYTQLLNGNIYHESEIGKGSAFFLELPVSISDSIINNPFTGLNNSDIPVTQKDNNLLNRVKKNILYVEDDLVARDVVRLALSKFYIIDLAKNSDLALSKVQEKHYDALLLDINLSVGVDGIELAGMIKNLPGYSNTPMIAVTAYASDDDQREFLEKGMTHYIAKPFMIKDLLDLLDQVFAIK